MAETEKIRVIDLTRDSQVFCRTALCFSMCYFADSCYLDLQMSKVSDNGYQVSVLLILLYE